MINMGLIIPVSVFIIALLIAASVFYYVGYALERKKLMRRLKDDGGTWTPQEGPAEARLFTSIKMLFMRIAAMAGELSKPKREEELTHMERAFVKAGYRNRNLVTIYYGAKVLLAILLPTLLLLIKFFFPKTVGSLNMMILTVTLALAGFYLPGLWLKLKIAARKEKMLEGFPDALDLLVVCVESGMGLDAAINRVGDEMKLSNEVVSEEFKTLNLELRAGKSRSEALRNLGLRTDLDEVSSLVTLLIQTDKFGTSIAQALRVHSDSMRTRRYQKAEEVAMKLPVKILFPMLFCIFPTIFIVIMGPPLIQAFRIWSSSH